MFIDTAKKHDIFSVNMVRDMANKTQLISDYNPLINRQAALERDLFRPAAAASQARSTVMDEAMLPSDPDIKTLEAEAVLYTIKAERRQFRASECFVNGGKENHEM